MVVGFVITIRKHYDSDPHDFIKSQVSHASKLFVWSACKI